MNDNNKMDRDKEHAGRKNDIRQKQREIVRRHWRQFCALVAAIAIVGTYTMRDYKTVKKEGDSQKHNWRNRRKHWRKASQEASGNAQKTVLPRSGRMEPEPVEKPKEWIWCRNGRDCKQKCCNSRKHRWIRK